MTDRTLRVLSLQPWYGGSHRQFIDGWTSRSKHTWTTLGLPDRKWKWRMRHAAIDFARQVNELSVQGNSWDIVVCTDMMNAAEFQTLVKPIRDLPLIVYFHENQFAYPVRGKQQPDHHFLFTNLVSALASNEAWFNSQFNLDSMIRGVSGLAETWEELSPLQEIESIKEKAKVVPPPIEILELNVQQVIDRKRERIESGEPLHLVWAARWEYDKNPDALLKCLELLRQQKVPFRLSVIGQQADSISPTFDLIHDKFELQIENWGYQESRKAYWAVLKDADVFLSTANHEFFGLSVAESVSVGAWPLLPNRLAYPELLDATLSPKRSVAFFYQSNAKDLAAKIRNMHLHRDWDFDELALLVKFVRDRYGFEICVGSMDQMLLDACS